MQLKQLKNNHPHGYYHLWYIGHNEITIVPKRYDSDGMEYTSYLQFFKDSVIYIHIRQRYPFGLQYIEESYNYINNTHTRIYNL